MLKGAAAMVVLALVAMFSSISVQKGCQDANRSATHLAYFPIRDMRRSVALIPQKGHMMAPDTGSVPTVGRERLADREIEAARFENPQAPDDSSIARGQRKFMRTCVPCHGATLAGDGPVAAQFM